jgi:MFS family permease
VAVNGAIALFIQAVVFPIAADRIGVFRLFLIVTVLHPIAYFLMPFLVWVPETVLYPAIYFNLTIRNIFSILVYPLLLIQIKEAAPKSVLGKVNGFAASAGAACRMIAPPVAGYLYTVGSRMDCTALAWWGSAAAALVGSIQCLAVQRTKAEDHDSCEVEGLVHAQSKQATVSVADISDDEY